MTSFKTRNAMRVLLFALSAMLIISFSSADRAFAFQKKTDTVSSGDVQFTDITTSADSFAAAKKKQAELAKHTSALKSAKADEKPKTLWQVFIAGLLGGFLALLMPCIYPLLPLTVSFFTKKSGNRAKGI